MIRLCALAGLLIAPPMVVAAAQIPEAWPSFLTQGGALAVLAWAVWYQHTRTIPAMGQRMDAQLVAFAVERAAERGAADEWEKVRHADSAKLNETMRDITAQCAATQAQMRDG